MIPTTSLEAYRSQTLEKISNDHARILEAIGRLGRANYEVIANAAGMDRHAVGRRLKELEQDQKIYKPGTQSKTKRGRNAFDYCLTNPLKVEHKIKKSSNFLNIAENIIQGEMFGN